jgi:AcrR family transcriptional regulator
MSKRSDLIAAGVEIARVIGIDSVTMSNVARKCNISVAGVQHYFKNTRGLRRAICKEMRE